MSKMNLDWHKNCLKNTYSHLERLKRQLEELQDVIKRNEQECTFYHVQVHNAEVEKKDGFDSELYMKKVRHLYITK